MQVHERIISPFDIEAEIINLNNFLKEEFIEIVFDFEAMLNVDIKSEFYTEISSGLPVHSKLTYLQSE